MRVTWASWVFGFLVILIAGVVGLVLKDGDSLPRASEVALWAGFGLVAISVLVRPGDASGHFDDGDGEDDDDDDGCD